MRRPSNNAITMRYGAIDAPYSPSSPHVGTDFSFQPDDRAFAVEGGTIVFVGWMGTAGNTVELQGAGGRKWRYGHLANFNVFQGQQVGEGHIIGIMGETGTWPDGSKSAFGRHLHLVLFINGNRTDPMSVLPASANNGGSDVITRNDIDILRIIGSEVKGWDYHTTHSGQIDEREIRAWEGQDFRRLIREAWGEAGAFRDLRNTAIPYYQNTRPVQEDTINVLQAKVSELTATLARMSEMNQADDTNDAAEMLAANNRINELTRELEEARKSLSHGQVFEPVKVVEPVVTKPKQSLLTKLILWAFARKPKA